MDEWTESVLIDLIRCEVGHAEPETIGKVNSGRNGQSWSKKSLTDENDNF